MVELTSKINWPGKVFRAWRQGQYGYSTLVTMVLPPGCLDIFKKEDIVPLVLRQNGLEGSHSTPRFKSKDKGVTLVTFGIAPQLVPGIRNLGGRCGMGMMALKINVKKEESAEETIETETANAPEATAEGAEASPVEDMGTTDAEEQIIPATFNYESA